MIQELQSWQPKALYYVLAAFASEESRLTKCFAVIYSNYEPIEVDSLWKDKKDAEARLAELSDPWHITEIEIQRGKGART